MGTAFALWWLHYKALLFLAPVTSLWLRSVPLGATWGGTHCCRLPLPRGSREGDSVREAPSAPEGRGQQSRAGRPGAPRVRRVAEPQGPAQPSEAGVPGGGPLQVPSRAFQRGDI